MEKERRIKNQEEIMRKKIKSKIMLLLTAILCFSAGALFTACGGCEHTYEDWSVTKNATCMDFGEMQRTCTACGQVETSRIEKGEHSFGEWVQTIASTCEEDGEHYRICTVCDYKQTETIPALEHVGGEWITDDFSHWKVCSECDEIFDRADHTFDQEKICTVCGFKYPYTAGIEYELRPDGRSYVVNGIGTATDKNIVLMSSYNSLPVTHIAENAFYREQITSITIPDSVTSIGKGAFGVCNLLNSITLPFVGATKNGASNTHFGYIFGADSSSDNLDFVPTSLKKVIVTSDTRIRQGAFLACRSIENVTLSDGVTHLEMGSFAGCRMLTSITLPESLESIGQDAFSGCYALESITIPNGVTSIGGSAFYECSSLESIVIPEGVTDISPYMFYDCDSLASITIPNSVTHIGSWVFYGCNSLNSAIFKNPYGWREYSSNSGSQPTLIESFSGSVIGNPQMAAHELTSSYKNYFERG